jgi:prepilin-type N-terminal cleavage/methylation domain-containing protein
MRRPHTRYSTAKPGFTIVEVAVVIVIVGILGAVAFPKIDVARYKADSVVTVVRSTMQQAQRASLVAQHDVIVSFDLEGNRIRLVWDANNNKTPDAGERTTWTPLSSGNKFAKPPIGVRGAVNDAVVGPDVKMLQAMPTVTFHRDGSLSSELEIYMSTMATPVRWRAVTVVQATGRTDWFRKNTTAAAWVSGVL